MIKSIEELEELINNTATDPDRVIYFSNPAYLSAIVGFDYLTGAVVYDFDKMCQSLIDEDPESWSDYDEAADFILYNMSYGTQGIEGIAPIVLMRPMECEEED